MVSLTALWLPILVAAILVFVASSILHMALTYHRADYRTVPSEDLVMDALRPFGIPPGDYMLPSPGTGSPQAPEFVAKLTRGPVLFMTVFPAGRSGMGTQLALWQHSIWYRRSWATTMRSTIDGLIYALLTGGVFGWLWL